MDLQRWTDPQAGARHMDMLQISRIGLDDRPDMFPKAPSDDAFSLAVKEETWLPYREKPSILPRQLQYPRPPSRDQLTTTMAAVMVQKDKFVRFSLFSTVKP